MFPPCRFGKFLLAIALALLSLQPGESRAGGIPINNGTGSFAAGFNNSLYAVNYDTGKATLMYTDAALATNGLNGVAYDEVTGIYYYTDNTSASTNKTIYGWNSRTGGNRFTVLADVTTLGVSVGTSGLGSGAADFSGGYLWIGVENNSSGNDQIWRVTLGNNGTTATAITVMGTITVSGNDFGDILVDAPNNKLYSFDAGNSQIHQYTISPFAFVKTDSITQVTQAARDAAGNFYLTGANIRQYNPATGTAGTAKTITTNGTTGLGSLNDASGFLDAEASIGQRVFFDTNANGIDNGEDGIAGLTVKLYDDLNNNGSVDAGETLLATVTTDATGAYLFDRLLPGTYVVQVSDPNSVLNGGTSTTGGNTQTQTIQVIGGTYLTHNFGYQDKRPAISVANVSVTEGTDKYAVFNVQLSRTTTTAIGIGLSVSNGTATSGTDFSTSLQVSTDAGATWAAGSTATFAAGKTSVLVRVPIIDDTTIETTENFTLNVTRTSGPASTASVSATGTIADNDFPDLSISDSSVLENAGSAVFTVTLSAASPNTTQVNYATSGGTATSGVDFTAVSGTLTFAPGVTSQQITVPIINDNIREATETYSVTLSAPLNANLVKSVGAGSIVDDGDNTAPVANNDTATTPEDTAVVISVLANDTDVDGDTLTVTGATLTSGQGTITFTASGVTYTPAKDYNGSASATYTISDGHGGTAGASIAITITPVNDAPVANNDTATTPEDTAVTVAVLANDTDVDGDTLTVTGATLTSGQGTITFTASGVTYTPAKDYNGSATASYTISDGHGGTAGATINLTVTPVNDAPVANNDTATTPEDTAVTVSVLANDTDVDGDTLTVTGATLTSGQGTITFTASKVTYTPAKDYNGAAVASYTISDGHGGTASATINITVTPVNDAPVANNDTATTPEDSAVTIQVLANDTDVDGDTLTVTGATLTSGPGTLTFTASAVTYTPAKDYNGPATASYTISDGHGGTASATINITVTPVNDAPVANNDTATTPEDTAVTIAVLANDTDVDGDTLSVTGATLTSGLGKITYTASGVTYTPAKDYNGPATATYTISDGNGGTASATINITVTPVNDAPVANNDTATTPEDTAVTIAVLANDTDVDGDTLSVTGATLTSGLGKITYTASGVTYTPAKDYNGPATATYTISDGNGGTASANINITVTPVNDAPIANNDTATTPEDTAVTIAVLANDTDVDGDTLTVTGATLTGGQGTITYTASGVTYTPAKDYNGPATASYTISDGNGGTASATIAITVTPVNDAPIARNDTATTPEDTAVTIAVLANDTDVDGDTLTVTGATLTGGQGTITYTATGVTYTPAKDYNGPASASYTISDGNGGTASATIAITVTPVNDAPIANNDTATTPEDSAVTIQVLANDTDVDGDTLTVTGVTLTSGQGTITYSPSAVTYTPAKLYSGPATATYTISDGHGGTASAIINITVTPVNHAPVASNDSATTPEDTAVTISVLANDTDIDGDTLTVTGATLTSGQGTITYTASGVTYTPAKDYNGPATATYTISDGNGGTAGANINITVTPVNDAPVANNDTATTPEDTAVTVSVLANDTDVDGDTLTVTGATLTGGQGKITYTASGVTYTPAKDYNGPAAATYTISDGHGGTASATINITVTPVNDAPIANNDTATTPEDSAVTIQVLANDTDVDGDTLTVTGATLTSGPGTLTFTASAVTYTPAKDYNGPATATYTISDGNGGTASAIINITVTPVNDAPIANNDTATTPEDTAVTIAVLANDTDVDGDTLIVTGATLTSGQGTITYTASGVTYTPAKDYNGPATATYTISDGNGGTATATINITVTPVNDAPVANNDTATTPEDTAVTIAVLANDTDVDGDTLTVTGATLTGGQGKITYTASGVTYTPAKDYNGPASASYTISDGNGGTATATIAITVTPVNDAPIANNDTATTPEDSSVTVQVLANDTDVDGDTLTVTGATLTSGPGTLTFTASAVTYTPAKDYNGPATASYTISDGHGGTASALINITVTPVNDAPVANNDVATTLEDKPVTIDVLANDTDVDGDTLSVTGATLTGGQGTITFTASGVTYTPAKDYNGPAAASYTISDGNGGTATATIAITVTPVNDAPVANNDTATTPEDSAVTIQVLANDTDVDGDTLTVTGATLTSGPGTLTFTASAVTYTPAKDYNGPATATYTISDGNGGTATATINITVTPVNDAPIANNDTATTPEDSAVTIQVLANDTDVDGDTLTVTGATLTSGPGTLTFTASAVTYTPAQDYNGPATATYTISDGHGGTATATISITVTPVNDAPVANNDTATTPEDTAVTVSVLANDTDVDGDTLTVTGATLTGGQGTITYTATGVTYTPAKDYNGPAAASYTISDGHGGTASATISITVTPVNDAPIANNDTATTPEDTAVTISVLANDTDVDGDTLDVIGVTLTSGQGTLTTNGKTVTWTPAPDFNGVVTGTYTITDGTLTASALITINVTPVNDAPVATDDVVTTLEDTPVKITVLSNDTDVDGDTLTVTAASLTSGSGTLSFTSGDVTFTPARNFNGPATAAYTISDGHGGTASAKIFITVTPVNDPPVAVDDTARTPQGQSVTVNVLSNDSDPEGDTLSVAAVSVIKGQGTATITSAGVTFTPAEGFNGPVILQYVLSDGQATSTALVTITVDGLPIALDDAATTTPATPVSIPVLLNDADPEGLPLTIVSASIPPSVGTLTIQGQALVFTPAQGVVGTVTGTYTVRDLGGNLASASVQITVADNGAQPIVAKTDLAKTNQQQPVTIAVLANDTDPAGGTLTVTSATVSPGQGTIVINNDGTLTFTAAAGFSGTATIQYTIRNAAGLIAAAPAMVQVSGPNNAPLATPDTAVAQSGVPKIISVLANDSDPDGDPLHITAIVNDPAGSATANPDGTITFTSAPGYTGPVTLTYTVSDPAGATASTTVKITVSANPVNQAPIATNDTATTPVNTTLDIPVLTNDRDPDGDVLTVTRVAVDPTQGVATINPDGTIHFVPATGFNGTALLTYTVSDPSGATATAVAAINVNDNPIAAADVALTLPGKPVIIPVLNNDTDPNQNPLTVVTVTPDPAQGTAVIQPDGSVTFTPKTGFTGTATLTYTIEDNLGGTATSTITVTVNTPPAPQPDRVATTIDAPLIISVLSNDTDADGDPLTVIAVTVDPAQGTVVINPDGTLTFTPAAGFTGPAVITYTVEDPNGGQATTTATVFRNDIPPTADGRTVYTYCKTRLTINALRTADDADGDPLTVIAITQGKYGKVTIRPDGTLAYVPSRNFLGTMTDRFTVTLSDGKGGTTTQAITVKAFGAIAGTFQAALGGGFIQPIAVSVNSATILPTEGRATITMTNRAAVSAQIQIDGGVIRLTGTLSGALQLRKTVRFGKKDTVVTLQYHDLTDLWTVVVENSDFTFSDIGGATRKLSRSTAGVWNSILIPQNEQPGTGVATSRVSRTGTATVVGRLPDGTGYSSGAYVNPLHQADVYTWLSRKATSLGGVVALPATVESTPTGSLFMENSVQDITVLDLETAK